MQKTLKKSISILLSILMVVSLFTVVPFTASAATITSDTSVDDISVGDILTNEIVEIAGFQHYALTLSANGFGTGDAAIDADMVFPQDRHKGFSNGRIFVEGEEPYQPYVKGEKVEQWIVTAIDHDEEAITLTGFTEAPELPDVIKDCTYSNSDSTVFANVPIMPEDYSDYSSLVDGAIYVDVYSDSIQLMDAKEYSYKFYDQTGTEIAAELNDSQSAPGSKADLSDDVTLYGKLFILNIPENFENLYIVATAPEAEPEPAVGTIYDSGEHDASELNTGDYIVSGIGSLMDETCEYTITLKAGTYTEWPSGESARDEDYTIMEAGCFEIGTDDENVLCFTDWMEGNYMPFVDGAIANAFYVESADHNAKTITLAGANYSAEEPTTEEPATEPTTEAAAEPITVVWDSYTGEFSQDTGIVKLTGATLFVDMGECIVGDDNSTGTFTTDAGVFTKIQISGGQGGFSGEGWSNGTWTGESSSVPFTGRLTNNEQEAEFTITFTITPASAPTTYTVTWKNGETVLKTDTVEGGTAPAYTGDVPEKAEDENNTYTFSGWTDGTTTYGATDTLPAVTADVTYTAVFTAVPKTYTVTWKNWNGETLATDTVVKGATPEYSGEAPTKAADAQNTYTFAAWDDGTTTYVLGVDDLPPVTADVTYTAVFTAETNTYKVTWKNWDGNVLKADENVPYGTVPEYKGARPEKPDFEDTAYTFIGWTPEVTSVTGDVEYTAEFGVHELIGDYYYVNGQRVGSYYGLIKYDGDFYYVDKYAKIIKNDEHCLVTTNGWTFADGTPIPKATYSFDADGKMIIPNGLVDDYYYINGVRVGSYYGLIQVDGDYYYVDNYAKIVKNKTKFLNTTNGLTFADGTPIPKATYRFDADGKMIIPNGIDGDSYYINGVKVGSYYGLVKDGNDYYYVDANAKIVRSKNKYLTTTNDLTFPDGTPIPKHTYSFDADGKMIYE